MGPGRQMVVWPHSSNCKNDFFAWNTAMTARFLGMACLGLALIMSLVAPASAQEPVQVICAPGQAPRPTLGFVIENGIIRFLDNACGNGAELPPPLGYSNVSVSPQTVDAGNSVQLSLNLSNYIVAPTSNTYDQCTLNVLRPNGSLESSMAVSALSSTLQITVPFAPDAMAGNWTLQFACRRFFTGQEIVVPSPPWPATAIVEVNSATLPPTSCTNLPSPMVLRGLSNYSAPYGNNNTGGFGLPFGEPFPGMDWPSYSITNKIDSSGELTELGLRVFSFVAPSNITDGRLAISSASSGVFATVNTQCGNFNVPTACKASQGNEIQWSTNPNATNRCILVPGETYYFQLAYFNRSQYQSSGTYKNSCSSSSPGSTVCNSNGVCNCTFQHRAQSVTSAPN